MITTKRLILRQPTLDDFAAYAEMWSSPEVLRHIRAEPYSAEEIWARFLRQAGGWHYLGFGYFTIVERDSGRMAGQAGFQDLRRAIEPSLGGTLEAGWTLHPAFQGRGYASEAALALFDWGSSHHAGRRATAIIAPDNHASLSIAAKVGLTEFARATYHGRPVVMMERPL